jgi:hypothetical protein
MIQKQTQRIKMKTNKNQKNPLTLPLNPLSTIPGQNQADLHNSVTYT